MKRKLKSNVSMKAVKIIFIITSIALMIIYYVNLLSYKQVYLNDDGTILTYKTKAKTVDEFFNLVNTPIRNVDKMNVTKDTEITKGMNIEIDRAFPVQIKYNNEVRKVFATEEPVATVLATNSITLSAEDYVSMNLDENVQPNIVIEVKDYSTKTIEVKENIPYTEKTIYSDDMQSTEKKVVTEGINGERVVKYKVTYMGEKEQKREKISENIIKKPVQKVIKKGTANIYTSPDGIPYKYKSVISMSATAYNVEELKGSTGHTCLGWHVKRGIVAVDPKVIPLGTKLYISGYGEAIAGDTGGAIKGNKIDLYMDTLKEVYSFGRRNVKVYVLGK